MRALPVSAAPFYSHFVRSAFYSRRAALPSTCTSSDARERCFGANLVLQRTPRRIASTAWRAAGCGGQNAFGGSERLVLSLREREERGRAERSCTERSDEVQLRVRRHVLRAPLNEQVRASSYCTRPWLYRDSETKMH